jgi:hypothetical protein
MGLIRFIGLGKGREAGLNYQIFQITKLGSGEF